MPSMIKLTKNKIIHISDEGIETEVKRITPFLTHRVSLSNDFTLLDFFKLIHSEQDIINIIFESHLGHHDVQLYINDCFKQCPLDDKDKDLLYLELSWCAECFNSYEYRKERIDSIKEKRPEDIDIFDESLLKGEDSEDIEDDVTEVEIYTDFHGWGNVGTDPTEKFIPDYGPLAIEYTPIYQIKHLPIHLNEVFVCYNLNKPGSIIVEGRKTFTIYDFIGGILDELSFCGTPERRSDISEHLDQMSEDLKRLFDKKNEDKDNNKDDNNE